MCGIAGIVAPIGSDAMSAAMQRMTDVIVHRGPDDAGHVIGDTIGIGMRRLSIIDVAGGHQPISNESKDIHVVCNGEIYNHNELRSELTSRGHRFETKSDAEVIVHLYEEMGEACIERLRGMFGLAIWDQRHDRLLIARDRLGKKPIFYAQKNDRLWFGSEMKSILAVEPSLNSPNVKLLGEFLQFAFVHQPDTMFRDIRRLPAASYGIWENGNFNVRTYWRPDWNPDESLTERDWSERLDSLLEQCVRVRLESEVPLGVFLSGGLDSSAVVAYAHRAGLDPLKTFTIAFDKPEWDESSDARRVAEHFGTEHHELRLTESMMRETFIDTLESITHFSDEPFGDASAIPTYHVSRLARQHVTVILSGDGGDELFAGYTSYRGAVFAQHYRRWIPYFMGRNVLPGLAKLASAVAPGSLSYKMKRIAKVLRDSALPIEKAYRDKVSIWKSSELTNLLTPDVYQSAQYLGDQYLPDELWQTLNDDTNRDLVSRLSEIDVRSYMLDDILVKVDRMSMAYSLEVRSPLLDHNLVELAARMPTRFKMNARAGKLIFRELVKPQLPPANVKKGKQGFSVPLREWFKGELADTVKDYLLAEDQLPGEIFQISHVEKVLDQHQRGDHDHSNKIWLLLAYASWNRQLNETHSPQPSKKGATLSEVS